jgi:hypothetical protein
MDSCSQRSGFGEPVVFVGKATVDANQYHVRGVVRVETTAAGDVFLEFSSSFLLGSRVEDFFCSVLGDTLRIVDRERGRVLEGAAAEQFLREELAMDFSVREALGLALGGRPDCSRIDGVEVRSSSAGRVVSGRAWEKPFRIEFAPDHRVGRAVWPVPGDSELEDRLRIDYEWASGPDGAPLLTRLVIHMEEREWRCKIVSTTD